MTADCRQQLIPNQGFASNSHVAVWFSVAGPVLKFILEAVKWLSGDCVGWPWGAGVLGFLVPATVRWPGAVLMGEVRLVGRFSGPLSVCSIYLEVIGRH